MSWQPLLLPRCWGWQLIMTEKLIAGVDEVGRGPLAGPVVAAAVIFHADTGITGLDDSKRLSESARVKLDRVIRTNALCFAIAEADVEEIDRMNIFQATLLAMQRAVNKLDVQPSKVLVDGKHVPDLPCCAEAVIGGDGLIAQISAASIIAKVYRDNIMQELHSQFPEYGFDRNKGYPTKMHRDALARYGATRHHRQTFSPVRQALGITGLRVE